ncbi:hypothetical protein [Acinetobacter phage P577]|uniref:hypothetical protein n=1 Tax=Acinetobacter phage YMC13/03/R2096 TaxID=1560342 RepID=UPI00052AB47C|nr:hypothetical protein ACQ36_gp040 [Acinetobacter phage YMC13/03/R2096]AIW02893.1 hypothetical protein BPABA577_01590 [Acinetobacter phage YMC13/03/R2096]WNT46221.1 hypothetical protein [Acinetobacter phage P577]
MEKIIKVGTKVTLEKSSRWAIIDENGESSPWNPIGTHGQVISINDKLRLCFVVKWSNGETNYYKADELKVLGQTTLPKYLIKKNTLYADEFYGNIGEATPLVGTDRLPLFVGDLVKIGFKDDVPRIHPVVKTKKGYFVMGYKSATLNGNTWDDVSYEKHESFHKEPDYGPKFTVRDTLDGVTGVE